MDGPLTTDRRADVRMPCTSAMGLRLVLRPGYVATILDVSPCGVQIQGARPLRPGTTVQLRLATALRDVSLTARVVRCAVWALDPQVGIVYRGAIQFNERCDWVIEAHLSADSPVQPESRPAAAARAPRSRVPGLFELQPGATRTP